MNDFSLALAIKLGGLCEQTYYQYDAYKKNKEWKLPTEYTFLEALYAVYEGDKVPIGFVAKQGNNIYISWRGTNNFVEWIQDSKFSQVKSPFFDGKIKIERGFTELYSTGHGTQHESPREICVKLLAQEDSIQNVYVTGHSLGGAMAVLNALDIVTNMQIAPVVYTLAGPRAGNHNFVYAYNQLINNSWRVVNSHDEVPKFPPKSCPSISHKYHYEHVNHEYPITFGNFWDLPHDHSLDNYIKKLEA